MSTAIENCAGPNAAEITTAENLKKEANEFFKSKIQTIVGYEY